MAGFFGLFGNKVKNVDEVTEDDRKQTQKGEAYFLESEDSRSLGKIKSTGKTEVNQKKIEPSSNDSTFQATPKRRSTDSSMDAFRKMARDLKK